MPPQKKEWTLMFYFASDNPLAPGIVSQLKAIKDAGYHPEANVIAQFDPHAEGAQTHIFDVNHVNKIEDEGQPRPGFSSSDTYVRNLTLDKLWKDDDIRAEIEKALNENVNGNGSSNGRGNDNEYGRDTPRSHVVYDAPVPPEEMLSEQSPRRSLSNFLQFCKDKYPARHYMLFILGHGLVVGNDLFLFDENAPQVTAAPSAGRQDVQMQGKPKESARQNYLMLAELGDVLREFKDGTTDKAGRVVIPGIGEDSEFELIGFHSCSMSSLEVAYQLQGTANYMLSSQGPAFVGSWPYRQILIRVFKELSGGFSEDDLTDATGLVARLREENKVSASLRGQFDEGAKRLLEEHDLLQKPGDELVGALLSELNKCISSPDLCKQDGFKELRLPEAARRLTGRKLRREGVRRLNRMLLAEAYPRTLASTPRVDVRRLLRKIFDYCLYNSHDFQLAGYSFDLCLCDLNRVPELTERLKGLTAALGAALDDELAKSVILLAHWDAQSYWQETYTDLYDFCFCLNERCQKAENYAAAPTLETLRAVREACGHAMDVLKRPPVPAVLKKEGSLTTDEEAEKKAALAQLEDGIVMASKYAGPSYQYSHGLSVFFPWSKPTDDKFWEDDYLKYKFNETGWGKFLDDYFKKTLRAPHREEVERDPRQFLMDLTPTQKTLDKITSRVLQEAGQLGKGGGNDVTGKGGGNDPTGGDCTCPSIKNHPNHTGQHRDGGGNSCVSPNFFAGAKGL